MPLLLILSILPVLLALGQPLYGDAAYQAGASSQYFLDVGFLRGWFLPADLDFGHCPLWGAYIALIRFILPSQGPWEAHLAILPWQIILTFQTLILARQRGLEKSQGFWICLAALCEPVVFAQSTQAGPETAILACLIWQWNLTERGHKFLALLPALFACLFSLRGIIGVLSLALAANQRSKVLILSPLLCYALWQFTHHAAVGWSGFHTQSEGIQLKSLIPFVLSWIDLGRVFILGLAIWAWRQKWRPHPSTFALGIGFIALGLANPILGHSFFGMRYLNPVFYFLLIDLGIFFALRRHSRSFGIGGIAILCFAQALFWLRPNTMSKPWDSALWVMTVATLEQSLKDKLPTHRLSTLQVKAAFPLEAKCQWRYLRSCADWAPDIATANYQLKSHWINPKDPPSQAIDSSCIWGICLYLDHTDSTTQQVSTK